MCKCKEKEDKEREGGNVDDGEGTGGWMSVIDYLPVDEEVRPNALLSQIKKCIISKVVTWITG